MNQRMSRPSTPSSIRRTLPGTKRWGFAGRVGARIAALLGTLVGIVLGVVATPAAAAWVPHLHRAWAPARPVPPDQSLLMDVPEKPGAPSKGKVAVFVFKGDDVYQPVRAEVVRVLRMKGLNVTTTLRPVDSAAQFREMAYALKLAVYVEGELLGEGARQSAHIRLRSGVTGQPIASAKFTGPTHKIVGGVSRGLWNQVGPAIMRSCSSARRPQRREREPLRIEAGSPLDNPIRAQGT